VKCLDADQPASPVANDIPAAKQFLEDPTLYFTIRYALTLELKGSHVFKVSEQLSKDPDEAEEHKKGGVR
jgi:hypothetical protein